MADEGSGCLADCDVWAGHRRDCDGEVVGDFGF